MSKSVSPSLLDRFGRRHPRLLITANVLLLIFVSLNLLATAEAPVVLYQAF